MENIKALYSNLVHKLIEGKKLITCMESMTGGFVASCITDIPGASAIFKGSYVCYSNEEKVRLGVPEEIIATFSVYSEETALAMAAAAKRDFNSDIAVGITGNAGNIDPANITGVPGIVFIAVISGDIQKTVTLDIDPTLTREKMKQVVAAKAAEEVLNLIC